MKKYRSRWSAYSVAIEEVEIKKETDKFVVWPSGLKGFKQSRNWWNYFDTFDEAKQYLLAKNREEYEQLKERIDKNKGQNKKIYEMRPKEKGGEKCHS